ncbi:uncharacterized protein LOC106669598 [Cimex lectularius]|uniref:CPR type cuticle protein n=1 Tax=Cimex lectularius TaxID=79782 RepID=A0A8I6S1J5_CIMLE|nr:uncharacterized protein LOC106669598 [Cimex lectularius]
MQMRRGLLLTFLLVCSVAANWDLEGVQYSQNAQSLRANTQRNPDVYREPRFDARFDGRRNGRESRPRFQDGQVNVGQLQNVNSQTQDSVLNSNHEQDSLLLSNQDRFGNAYREPCTRGNIVNIYQTSRNCRNHQLDPLDLQEQPNSPYVDGPYLNQQGVDNYRLYPESARQQLNGQYSEPMYPDQVDRRSHPTQTLYPVPQPTRPTHSSTQDQNVNVGPQEVNPVGFSNADSRATTATNVYLSCPNERNSQRTNVRRTANP